MRVSPPQSSGEFIGLRIVLNPQWQIHYNQLTFVVRAGKQTLEEMIIAIVPEGTEG